jgi:hypothetical protein
MPVENKLPQGQFDTVIRWVKKTDADRLKQLDLAFSDALRRLGKRKVSGRAAVVGTPEGSDQFDGGSLVEWLKRIPVGDVEATAQVESILATIRARIA